jgi:hypothetical protein
MNELDLIRSFRADLPAPSAAATARAERAWRRPKRRARMRRLLTPPQRGARGFMTPRNAAALAAVLAVAGAAAFVLPSGEDAGLGAQPASAAGVLRHAAAAQAGGVTRPLRPGEYWYVRRRTTWGTDGVREDWVGVDGRRRWVMPVDGKPGKRSEYRAGPPKHLPFYDGAKFVSYAELLDLPRDTEALYRRLRQAAVDCECGNGIDEETFVIAADLLRDNPLPADLRAAIMRATALIPGIDLLDDERDVAGRRGVGVAYDAPGRDKVLIFDPRTYELLGEREGDGGSADLESAIVSSIDERP